MKRIILGDTHGRISDVEKIYNKENPDSVIMLGDYVDSHDNISDEDQHNAVLDLLKLRHKHLSNKNGEFIMLMGNHDFHYFYNKPITEKYSDYSSIRQLWATDFFRDIVNNGYMTMVYIDEQNKTIYSHAGISSVWLSKHNINIYDINNCIKTNPDVFRFTYGSTVSWNGNSPESSCIWIRPFALLKTMYDNNGIWTQIVGHTTTKKVLCISPDSNSEQPIEEAKLILTDVLSKQYIVEELDDNGKLISRSIGSI